jgi:hypothetical protein
MITLRLGGVVAFTTRRPQRRSAGIDSIRDVRCRADTALYVARNSVRNASFRSAGRTQPRDTKSQHEELPDRQRLATATRRPTHSPHRPFFNAFESTRLSSVRSDRPPLHPVPQPAHIRGSCALSAYRPDRTQSPRRQVARIYWPRSRTGWR